MAIDARLVGAATGSGASASGTTTTGSTLIYVTAYDPGATLNSVALSGASGTFSAVGTVATTSIGSKISAYVAENITGSGSTVATPSWTGTPAATGWLVEVTGAATASLDVNVQVSAKASPYTLASGTLGQANECLIVFVANDDGSSAVYTASSPAGLTILGQNNDTTNFWTSAVAKLLVTSTASVSPTFTLSAGTNVAIKIATFKEANTGTLVPVEGAAIVGGLTPRISQTGGLIVTPDFSDFPKQPLRSLAQGLQ